MAGIFFLQIHGVFHIGSLPRIDILQQQTRGMKMWLTGLFLLMWSIIHAQIRWDGDAGDGQWNTALNWTGNSVPLSGDNVVLDNTFINGSYTVSLPGGQTNVTIASLSLSPILPGNITLVLPLTNTADPGLSVTSTGDAVTLNAGGWLRNSSGATTGSGISIAGLLRINNGGRYVHNTSRGNASIVSQLSTAVGTEYGEFEFDSPSGSATISLSNRHYGILILSSVSNSGTASYIGSGASPVNVHGNLVIGGGVNFSISMTAAFIIHGNWQQTSVSTFNLQSSSNSNIILLKGNLLLQGIVTESGTGFPKIELNGQGMQQFSITNGGVISNSIELVMNNVQGLTLLSPVLLPYRLHLNSGKVFTTNINILTLPDGSVTTGGSVNRFVVGPLRKIGDDSFVFRVGDGNIYAPLAMANGGGEQPTDQFTASYHRQSPQSISSMNFQPPIDHISYVEYWQLTRDIGNAEKFINLRVGELSFARDALSLLVSKYSGSTWINHGQSSFIAGASTAGYITGDIVSNLISDFGTGFFTIATSSPGSINPLPVKFVAFDAAVIVSDVKLRWKVAEIPLPATVFEIERSIDSVNFNLIGTLVSSAKTLYHFNDIAVNSPTCYYRVRSREANGIVTLSPVKMINSELSSLVKLYPNPAKDHCILQVVSSANCLLQIILSDASGRELRNIQTKVTKGINYLNFILNGLNSGMYIISIQYSNNTIYRKLLKV